MSNSYYIYRIYLENNHDVKIEKYDHRKIFLGRTSGKFCYQEKEKEIQNLLEFAINNELNAEQNSQLGEALFKSLFDDRLGQEFINFYDKVVLKKEQKLRIQLDIDEKKMPEFAALPWEFLCIPEEVNQGTIWLGTDPNLIFSRRRALWNSAKTIQLEQDEKLRIALAISAPENEGPVEYAEVQEYLEELAKEQSERIELLPIINPATTTKIDRLLEKKPHIFHFIGHGRFEDGAEKKVGEIALGKKVGKKILAKWVDEQLFAQLFVRHRPGIVVLQACEGGKQSAYEAFKGVASKILDQSIPVVVAMQYKVQNATANAFSEEFYKRLAKDEPVDIAAQNGRFNVALQTDYSGNDFATPVIFMSVEDGCLFQKEEVQKKIVSDSFSLSEINPNQTFNIIDDNVVENQKNQCLDDNNYVYLAIDLKLESTKIQKNDADKFLVNTWLAIPQSSQSFYHKNLLNTFEYNRTYSQAEVEEKIMKLIAECNEELANIFPPEKDWEIAIEWVLPNNLLSLPVDCWEYRKNERIGRGKFLSVHIRSSQRLHIAYKHYHKSWKDKWNYLQGNIQNINLGNYILACQCQNINDNYLKNIDNKKKILGINLPFKIEELENITYELMIETGIPIALWSRCKESNVNHLIDLDTLINPNNENVLNLQYLPQYVEQKRLEPHSNDPHHLGHHLCFLCENPYNYPRKRKLNFGY
ncbi:MAG: CHAT domain-containing protein [Trichodesmium sp. St11_bin5]|nr:CHAT domain-containing protein [Trichodesmium sp. St11_bin5]